MRHHCPPYEECKIKGMNKGGGPKISSKTRIAASQQTIFVISLSFLPFSLLTNMSSLVCRTQNAR